LVLKDDELDDKVLLRDDLNNLCEGACWMSIVKFNTTKHFGNQPFFQKMDVAWGFAREWKIHPVEDNLFILQISCLGDSNIIIMQEGSWIFRHMGVMLQPYDGIADPSSIILNRIHPGAYVVPCRYSGRNGLCVTWRCIGEVCSVDIYVLGASGTSFVQVRVKIDVKEPLTRIMGLHPEGNELLSFNVMYENLPQFCEICADR
jgi:hypothetical protein